MAEEESEEFLDWLDELYDSLSEQNLLPLLADAAPGAARGSAASAVVRSIAQFGKWTDFVNRRFTLTVVAQHVADDSRKVGAQTDCLSRLPISLGNSALQIGAAASIESLVFSAPSSSVKSGRWEERMPYQAAVKRSTEAVLHQFVFDGSPLVAEVAGFFGATGGVIFGIEIKDYTLSGKIT